MHPAVHCHSRLVLQGLVAHTLGHTGLLNRTRVYMRELYLNVSCHAGLGAAWHWQGSAGAGFDPQVMSCMQRFLSGEQPRMRVLGGTRSVAVCACSTSCLLDTTAMQPCKHHDVAVLIVTELKSHACDGRFRILQV